jgi:hypothetical protein
VRDHIKLLGILNMVMGGLTALVGIVVLLIFGGAAGFIAAGMHEATGVDPDHAALAAPIAMVIGLCIAGFLLLVSAPAIIGGWGLIKGKSWSRVLMIVISALHLLSFPIGTALGIYGLWVLLNEQSRQFLDGGGPRYTPQPI